MPLKTLKKESAENLTLEWALQVKNYKLSLDRKRCVGCQICSLACPKQAITTLKQPKNPGEKAKKAQVDIDLAKCVFCGICDVACPFGAVKVTLNGAHDLSVLAKESYPQLIRDITVDSGKCPKECVSCESACPLALIKVSVMDCDRNRVENISSQLPSLQKDLKVNVSIQKDYCPTCGLCEVKCPPGTVKVKKAIEGAISINQSKCTQGCHDCLDVCPITGALTLGADQKVHLNKLFCVFCGACKNVCPVDEALNVKRTRIHHTPVHSGTWNKSLERLTSTLDITKELCSTADQKRLEAVQRFRKKGHLHG